MRQDLTACVTDTNPVAEKFVSLDPQAVDMSVSSGAEFSDDESQVCLSIIKQVRDESKCDSRTVQALSNGG